MNDTPPAIDVRGLTKRYGGRAVVDNLSLRLARGRICGFLGPNGSGKTTTIRMLCGLLTPDAGEGTCLGLPIGGKGTTGSHATQIRRQVGYMTQRFGLYEDLSIRENLEFLARLYELPQRRATVDRTLERLGLGSRQKQLAGALSGGWKQRLALAACLMHSPKLLLLDEPTAGVDPKARRDFWDQIHELAAEGITVLVSTHYMDEAERCHELAYIAYGRLLARGSERSIVEGAGLTVWALRLQASGRGEGDTGGIGSDAGGEAGGIDSGDGGERLAALVPALKAAPGVLSVAAFGSALHVAGRDAAAVDAAVAPLARRGDLVVERVGANLEDVFISLIGQAQDNFAATAGGSAAGGTA